jgi:hypothetical protein
LRMPHAHADVKRINFHVENVTTDGRGCTRIFQMEKSPSSSSSSSSSSSKNQGDNFFKTR